LRGVSLAASLHANMLRSQREHAELDARALLERVGRQLAGLKTDANAALKALAEELGAQMKALAECAAGESSDAELIARQAQSVREASLKVALKTNMMRQEEELEKQQAIELVEQVKRQLEQLKTQPRTGNEALEPLIDELERKMAALGETTAEFGDPELVKRRAESFYSLADRVGRRLSELNSDAASSGGAALDRLTEELEWRVRDLGECAAPGEAGSPEALRQRAESVREASLKAALQADLLRQEREQERRNAEELLDRVDRQLAELRGGLLPSMGAVRPALQELEDRLRDLKECVAGKLTDPEALKFRAAGLREASWKATLQASMLRQDHARAKSAARRLSGEVGQQLEEVRGELPPGSSAYALAVDALEAKVRDLRECAAAEPGDLAKVQQQADRVREASIKVGLHRSMARQELEQATQGAEELLERMRGQLAQWKGEALPGGPAIGQVLEELEESLRGLGECMAGHVGDVKALRERSEDVREAGVKATLKVNRAKHEREQTRKDASSLAVKVGRQLAELKGKTTVGGAALQPLITLLEEKVRGLAACMSRDPGDVGELRQHLDCVRETSRKVGLQVEMLREEREQAKRSARELIDGVDAQLKELKGETILAGNAALARLVEEAELKARELRECSAGDVGDLETVVQRAEALREASVKATLKANMAKQERGRAQKDEEALTERAKKHIAKLKGEAHIGGSAALDRLVEELDARMRRLREVSPEAPWDDEAVRQRSEDLREIGLQAALHVSMAKQERERAKQDAKDLAEAAGRQLADLRGAGVIVGAAREQIASDLEAKRRSLADVLSGGPGGPAAMKARADAVREACLRSAMQVSMARQEREQTTRDARDLVKRVGEQLKDLRAEAPPGSMSLLLAEELEEKMRSLYEVASGEPRDLEVLRQRADVLRDSSLTVALQADMVKQERERARKEADELAERVRQQLSLLRGQAPGGGCRGLEQLAEELEERAKDLGPSAAASGTAEVIRQKAEGLRRLSLTAALRMNFVKQERERGRQDARNLIEVVGRQLAELKSETAHGGRALEVLAVDLEVKLRQLSEGTADEFGDPDDMKRMADRVREASLKASLQTKMLRQEREHAMRDARELLEVVGRHHADLTDELRTGTVSLEQLIGELEEKMRDLGTFAAVEAAPADAGVQ